MANAASAQEVKEQERRRKNAALIAQDDLRFVMASDKGRRFVHGLIEFCGPFRSAFSTNGSQENFNLGQQNVGLKLFADIEAACPEKYLVMMEESKLKEDTNNG